MCTKASGAGIVLIIFDLLDVCNDCNCGSGLVKQGGMLLGTSSKATTVYYGHYNIMIY